MLYHVHSSNFLVSVINSLLIAYNSPPKSHAQHTNWGQMANDASSVVNLAYVASLAFLLLSVCNNMYMIIAIAFYINLVVYYVFIYSYY